MKDVIKVSAVNFKAAHNNKKENIEKILHFISSAAKEKSDLVVLPELCTTGYDVFASDMPVGDKAALCEGADGESVAIIKAAAQKNGIYTVFGFAESCGDKFYNSAAAVSADGEVAIYRKLHLFGREGLFFARGSEPVLLDTPWGRTGIGICYDTYNFPELLRYYAYKGARLYLNPTAMAFENDSDGAKESFCSYYRRTLEYNVVNTGMFVVSSNLTGVDDTSRFGGGSLVMGVGEDGFKRPCVHYFAGSIENENEGIFTAEIDLTKHNPRLFVPSAITGDTDFKPEIYCGFYREPLIN